MMTFQYFTKVKKKSLKKLPDNKSNKFLIGFY